jgi:NET1-associated nuclear protein 1 (U3 small nucleolar RNA-associated protein 17)
MILICQLTFVIAVWWSYNIQVDQIAVDQQSGVFAVACNAQRGDECRLIVFEPNTPVPKFVQAISEKCKALTWIPTESDEASSSGLKSNIVYLNHKYDLQVLHASAEDLDGESGKQVTDMTKDHSAKSFLADIFGKRNKSNEDRRWDQQRIETAEALRREAATASRSNVATKAHRGTQSNLLDAPSHVIPGVDNIFETFMDSIMPKRPGHDEQEVDVDENMEDDEITASQDESEVENSHVAATEPMLADNALQATALSPAFTSLRAFFSKTAGM